MPRAEAHPDTLPPERNARMKRLSIAIALLLLPTSALAAGANDPKQEQVRLTAADNTLARRTTLRLGDLAAAWKVERSTGADDERTVCSGFDPDFSAFTITGKAQSSFSHAGGGWISSAVEVYASHEDAVGDFRVGSQAAAAKCMASTFAAGLASGAGSSVKTRITSSGMVAGPRVGERSVVFRIVGDVSGPAGHVPVYFDVLAVQRGRSIVAVVFMGVKKRLTGQQIVARALAARMR